MSQTAADGFYTCERERGASVSRWINSSQLILREWLTGPQMRRKKDDGGEKVEEENKADRQRETETESTEQEMWQKCPREGDEEVMGAGWDEVKQMEDKYGVKRLSKSGNGTELLDPGTEKM